VELAACGEERDLDVQATSHDQSDRERADS
jgi:hypothetical protein